MENKSIDARDTNAAAVEPPKKQLGWPVAAFLLVFVAPFLFDFIAVMPWGLWLFGIFGMVLSPITGVVAGVVALCLGKKRIGKAGIILAGLAVIMPILLYAGIIPYSLVPFRTESSIGGM